MTAHRFVPNLKPALGVAAAALFALASFTPGAAHAAQNVVSLSLTLKAHKFEPTDLHAPAGRQIAIHVKNLNPAVSEFESGELHFEKIVPAGKEIVVYVRPLRPGRYRYFDDFHRATQGYLIVP
jgi:Cupredoxin-like domain